MAYKNNNITEPISASAIRFDSIQTPPAVSAPPSAPQKKRHLILLLWVVGVMIIAVIVVLVYVAQSQTLATRANALLNRIARLEQSLQAYAQATGQTVPIAYRGEYPVMPAMLSGIATDNWKPYADEVFGISFRYPSNWFAAQSPEALIFTPQEDFEKTGLLREQTPYVAFSLYEREYAQTRDVLSPDEWVVENVPDTDELGFAFEKKWIRFSLFDAFVASTSPESGVSYYYVFGNEYVYAFSSYTPQAEESFAPYILATATFENGQSTADWNRYFTEDYEFLYPRDWVVIKNSETVNASFAQDGTIIAQLVCPMHLTDFSPWDITKQTRTFYQEGEPYTASLWFGAPRASHDTPMAMVYMYKDNALDGGTNPEDAYMPSCTLAAEPVEEDVHDIFSQIFQSVR